MRLGIFLLACFAVVSLRADDNVGKDEPPRIRVIMDNDYSGDPDGLFQLAHHVLSPSVEVRAIIGSHLNKGDTYFDPSPETAANAKRKAEQLLEIMKLSGKYQVLQGSNVALDDVKTPHASEGAKAIVQEAMRTDTNMPLYVVCGGGLTEIASAYLLEPRIAERLTLVWIGGMEYADTALPPPRYSVVEYNTNIDINAAQVVFNHSNIRIWQIPRNAYRQCLVSTAIIKDKMGVEIPLSKYLLGELGRILARTRGEAYVLGDNPLVLVTALQSNWEADAASSFYTLRPAPRINNNGAYEINRDGRIIRVFDKLDVTLMLDDMFAKFRTLDRK